MKKNLATSLLLLAFLFAFSGCKKFIDKYFPGHRSDPDATVCRITSVTQGAPGESGSRVGTFHYNTHGDLDSITFDIPTGSAGAQFHYFKYNAAHRLIEYRADYSHEPDDYYFIHKYVYDGDRIIRDTSYVREAGSSVDVADLVYDNEGRVIRENRFWLEGDGEPINQPLEPFVYEYDADGNLQPGSGETQHYDDQTSYLSTSKVLPFTQRNYSRNNALPVNSYNAHHLPLGFGPASYGTFLQWGQPLMIYYDCK